MEFTHDAHRACYEKAVPWLREIFGDFAHVREDDPVVIVAVGSAMAVVAFHPWGEDDATICTRSFVVTGVEITPELTHDLLRRNDRMRFGAFGLDGDDDIFFEHTIVGSSCDRGELKASVMAVIATADQVDEELVARWGGQRAVDRAK